MSHVPVYGVSFGRTILLVFSSSAVNRGFEAQLGQTEDYKIGICCFSGKHVAFKGKVKLARNQDNVSDWNDIATCVLLFQ